MATATTVKFGQLLVLVGDGADPETFGAPCGFTSKSFTRTNNVNETEVPDCDDPDLPSDIERDINSRSASISGSGVMAQESAPVWREWYNSGQSRNVKVIYPEGASTVTRTQKFHLTSYEVTGDKGQRVATSVQMESDGSATEVVA